MAFRMINCFRIQVTIATFLGLPAATITWLGLRTTIGNLFFLAAWTKLFSSLPVASVNTRVGFFFGILLILVIGVYQFVKAVLEGIRIR